MATPIANELLNAGVDDLFRRWRRLRPPSANCARVLTAGRQCSVRCRRRSIWPRSCAHARFYRPASPPAAARIFLFLGPEPLRRIVAQQNDPVVALARLVRFRRAFRERGPVRHRELKAVRHAVLDLRPVELAVDAIVLVEMQLAGHPGDWRPRRRTSSAAPAPGDRRRSRTRTGGRAARCAPATRRARRRESAWSPDRSRSSTACRETSCRRYRCSRSDPARSCRRSNTRARRPRSGISAAA